MAEAPEGELPLSFLHRHAHHHGRFYLALLLGVLAFLAARRAGLAVPTAVGSDVFFTIFLVWSWWLVFRLTNKDLARKAEVEDEGAFIVTLLTLAALVYISYVIFTALNAKAESAAQTALVLAGAPLGWLMLQTVMAFHYADLYYRGARRKGYVAPIDFPECPEPGPWEFIYVSTVIGMTAQVSDTDVRTTAMRRAMTGHAIASFFFNTVLIAMAVNAAVSKGASG